MRTGGTRQGKLENSTIGMEDISALRRKAKGQTMQE
jgi:hypothetical protein